MTPLARSLAAAALLLPGIAAAQPDPAPIPVTIEVNAARDEGPVEPIWRFFGPASTCR